MLGNYSVKDYNSFKEIFGSRRENGRIINKILISFWKYRYQIDKDFRATSIKDLNSLYSLVIGQLSMHGLNTYSATNNQLDLGKYKFSFYSAFISKPELCPYDYRLVSYIDKNTGKKCSVKAGKFFRSILNEHKVRLDESSITYCSEVFQQDWEAFSKGLVEGVELHIDDNFKKIYTSKELIGNFNSCMVDRNHHTFYSDSVKAKAAYITKDGKIIARCIIFPEVYQKDSNRLFRYAERQYATNDIYKQLLINKLIEAKAIDIYKAIGAGCSQTQSILDIKGNRLDNPNLWVKCNLKSGDIVSYMDSFRNYYPELGKAYNYVPTYEHKMANLATTSISITF